MCSSLSLPLFSCLNYQRKQLCYTLAIIVCLFIYQDLSCLKEICALLSQPFISINVFRFFLETHREKEKLIFFITFSVLSCLATRVLFFL